jgi:hypothetical protein
MESLDLLFAHVGHIDRTQQQFQMNQDITTKALEQIIAEQEFLSCRVIATAQAVPKLMTSAVWRRTIGMLSL